MAGVDGTHAAVAVLLGSLLVGIGFGVGGPAMQSIVPSLIRDGELPTAIAEQLGGGTQLVGVLSAAFGIGAAVGMTTLALLRGRVASRLVSSIGLWLLAFGCALLAVDSVVAVALAGFAVAGLGFGWAMTGNAWNVQAGFAVAAAVTLAVALLCRPSTLGSVGRSADEPAGRPGGPDPGA